MENDQLGPTAPAELVSPERARAQLERILASTAFARTRILRRFLSFVVNQTLSDPAAPIKEYCVALAVFNRPESFDPHRDPIVRVQARRLRTKLDEFYRNAPNEPIEIILPPGTYVPFFRNNTRKEGATLRLIPGPTHRAIAVLPFQNIAHSKKHARSSSGFVDEMIGALHSLKNVRVFSWHNEQPSAISQLHAIARDLKIDVLLGGTIHQSPGKVRVLAYFVRTEDGSVVWTGVFRRTPTDLGRTQQGIARAIARAAEESVGRSIAPAENSHYEATRPAAASHCNASAVGL